jgi:hypothetical protein
MKLTSSLFASALGVGYQSRQKLFRTLTGREERDAMNERMQWGIDHEHYAVAGVEAITGLLFRNTGKRQRHIEREILIGGRDILFGSTPDGILRNDRRDTGLEVKCPNPDGGPYEGVPFHYIPQVQGQMWVCNLAEVYFSAWTPDAQKIWLVPRDEKYIEWMSILLREFMGYVKNDEEPKRKKKPTPPEVKYEEIT